MHSYREVTRPYPGLRAFESWEAEIFFGRKAHTDRMLEILKREHFLAVIGPSGSGKSSLVRAGLLPELPLGGMGTGSDWCIVVMRPGDRPIRSLAQGLVKAYLGDRTPDGDVDEAASGIDSSGFIEADLHRGSLSLLQVVSGLRGNVSEPGNLLVLVDQFEEIFTYAGIGHQREDEADLFVDLLLNAREAKESRIFVVLTMRTDFLGDCVRFLKLPDAINRAQYLTPRLTSDELRAAITGPGRLFGLEIDPDLVNELVNAMGYGSDQLPVLQHALARMWVDADARKERSIGFDDLRSIGGIEKALSKHAEEILDRLKPDEAIAAQWLFRGITEMRGVEVGGQAVRHPQSLEQLSTWSDVPWKEFVPVLKAFGNVDANFLLYKGKPDYPEESGATIIDISHEALIRQWESLRAWVGRETKAAKEYRLIRERAQDERIHEAALLHGADLVRALEWLFNNKDVAPKWAGFEAAGGGGQGLPESGQPTESWAGRYCLIQDPRERAAAAKEFTEVKDFINRSHAIVLSRERRDRLNTRLLQTMAAACLLLAIFAGWFAFETFQQKTQTEAQYLWHPLRFSEKGSMDSTQREGLLTLARSGMPERKAFIEAIRSSVDLAGSFSSHSQEIVDAVVGVDPNTREWLIGALKPPIASRGGNDAALKNARILGLIALEAQDADELLALIRTTDDRPLTRDLDQGLIAAAARLEANAALAFAEKLRQGMLLSAKNRGQVTSFGRALAATTTRMDTGSAAVLARNLVQDISEQEDSALLSSLRSGLVAVAGRLDAGPAESLAERLAQSIQETSIRENEESPRVDALSSGLAAAAAKMNSPRQLVFAQKVLEITETRFAQLVEALNQDAVYEERPEIGKEKPGRLSLMQDDYAEYSRRVKLLGKCLRVAAGQLNETGATSLVADLQKSMRRSEDSFHFRLREITSIVNGKKGKASERDVVQFLNSLRLQVLGVGLAQIASAVQPSGSEAVAKDLVELIRKTFDSEELEALGGGVALLVEKLDLRAKQAFASKLAQSVEETENLDRIMAYLRSVGKLVDSIDGATAAALSNALVAAIQKTVLPEQTGPLGQTLASIAGRIDAGSSRMLADKLIEAIRGASDSDQLKALGQALASTVGRVDAESSGILADKLVRATRSTLESDQIKALGQGLASMADKIDAGSSELADRLIRAIHSTSESDQLKALGQGLALVGGRLDADGASAVTGKLMGAIRKSNDSNEAEALGKGMALAAAKVDLSRARTLADALVDAIAEAADSSQAAAFGKGLTAAASRLDQGAASALADKLAEAIEKLSASNEKHLGVEQGFALSSGLATTMAKLDVKLSNDVSDKVIQALEEAGGAKQALEDGSGKRGAVAEQKKGAPETNPSDKLGHAFIKVMIKPRSSTKAPAVLTMIASNSESKQAQVLAEKLIVAVEKTSDSDTLEYFTSAFRSAVGKLDQLQAVELAGSLTNAVLKIKNATNLATLRTYFTALSARLEPGSADVLADRLLAIIPRTAHTVNGNQLYTLLTYARSLLGKVKLNDARAGQWIVLCKYPFAPKDAIMDAVRRFNSDSPRKERGFWAFVEWANGKYPLGLSGPI